MFYGVISGGKKQIVIDRRVTGHGQHQRLDRSIPGRLARIASPPIATLKQWRTSENLSRAHPSTSRMADLARPRVGARAQRQLQLLEQSDFELEPIADDHVAGDDPKALQRRGRVGEETRTLSFTAPSTQKAWHRPPAAPCSEMGRSLTHSRPRCLPPPAHNTHDGRGHAFCLPGAGGPSAGGGERGD